jgi:hypothetical protein
MISEHHFVSECVLADGKHFCDCAFRNCTLLYSGAPVIFEACRFHGCRFEFTGAAGRTVQFLDCFGLWSRLAADQFGNPADSALNFVN